MMQLLQGELHLVQELHGSPQDPSPLVHLDAVELLLQGQDLRPLRSCLRELAAGVQGLSGALASSNLPKLLTPSGTHSPLGQGQTVPGLESVGCPLQGPKAVKEEDVEGDEDDEARGRGQRSRIGI